MRLSSLPFLLLLLLLPLSQARVEPRCDIPNADKIDCAPFEADCNAAGCCWVPAEMDQNLTRGTPWCFYGTDQEPPPDPCAGDVFNWAASDPGFTDEIYQVMYEKYEANLNIDGTGAIVAAPDLETPGGSYYYHWMRDAGLSIKAWMDINDNDYEKCRDALDGYVKWTGIVQHKTDANCDVRIEPKFTIEDQEPYGGGWCRPQTDGPALRAMALSKWGNILIDNGMEAEAKSTLWPLISYDLEWVVTGWTETGCDLWEEVRSDDFFWNRMAFMYCLKQAADFADRIGESAGAQYRSVADDVAAAIVSHWNGDYLYESENRPDDGAVIHAITTFGEVNGYPPNSDEAAGTISYLVRAFCREYKINQEDNAAGIPGILIGRYPNDSYAGGNPWQLLCAVLAECFYTGASITFKAIKSLGDFPLSREEHGRWMDLLYLEEGATAQDLARAQVSAGDATMTRLWEHVKADGGKIDEQIDKNTGVQASAEDLTWSYANILHALHIRKGLSPDAPTTSTESSGTTTTSGGDQPTQPGPGSTTAPPDQTCCREVSFESSGSIGQAKPELVGKYSRVGSDSSGRIVYKKDSTFLHYAVDVVYKFEAWIFSSSADDKMGEVVNEDKNSCVDATASSWEILVDSDWQQDETATVTCASPSSSCCSGFILSSTGGIASTYPEVLGTYQEDPANSGEFPAFVKENKHLYFLKDPLHHFEGWTISDDLSSVGSVTNVDSAACAEKADAASWEFLSGSEWQTDSTLSFECIEVADCCPKVTLASTGLASSAFPQLMGEYSQTSFENGRPVYTKGGESLRYFMDVPHHWEGWVVGEGLGSLSHDGDADCPASLGSGWDVADGDEWQEDSSLTITCSF